MVGTLDASQGLASTAESSPDGHNIRSRVHEYGGGEYAISRQR